MLQQQEPSIKQAAVRHVYNQFFAFCKTQKIDIDFAELMHDCGYAWSKQNQPFGFGWHEEHQSYFFLIADPEKGQEFLHLFPQVDGFAIAEKDFENALTSVSFEGFRLGR